MLLRVTDLKKSYAGADGPVPVLRGIDMQVEAGQTVALTGESGSGKSTLLHLIGGLDTADEGKIILEGREISRMNDAGRAAVRRSSVGIIFQQFNLIPSLDVAANIAFQARLAGSYNTSEANALAASLGLTEHLRKYPEQLSGGQQQRVAIARALAAKPKLILADEPTGNLDEATAGEVMAQMLALVSQTGAALVMVTHSPRLATQMERQLHLSKGMLA
ncbi:ABC transporter ATP-binding protein [Sulfitobacter guttiformis]|uniref:Putative ABC transport system ATP-binding protein n=1 Tax=Sulfitobacter guttiformis TaxID=74349 RepID=A0A420DPN8_9RHOB|nr:ABC transporter ATP-binding protein [Sulfitobacter guttiformis]KIN73455.1 ABC transporter, ATPase subunit [Sulfitobacter guttiformis KCTC 32187]RKE96117.1 putative ABC transport system ATP-binding protein [Sulfitobacter guttiformis]